MTVEFFIFSDLDMSNAATHVSAMLNDLAAVVEVELEWIDRVVVAEYERFGDALASFGGTRKYTNANGLVAAGKTIRMPNTTPVRTSIIFALPIVATVMEAARNKGWNVKEWTADEQRNFYVLLHELGHCRDHALRPPIINDGTRRDPSGERIIDHNIANLCAFNFSEMYSEIPACVFGAVGYTDEVRALDVTMNNEAFRGFLRKLTGMIGESPPNYTQISHDVAGIFWFVLFQHGKFVGSSLGNPTLTSREPEELWDVAAKIPEVAATLKKAGTAISSAWSVYPEIPASLLEELTKCFHTISSACGYSLEVRNGQEGVWWNRLKVSLVLHQLGAMEPLPT